MRLVRTAIVAFAAGLSAGCATVAHGPRQTVLVTSNPSGATVTVLSGGAYAGRLAMVSGMFAFDYAIGAAYRLPTSIDLPICR